MTEQAAAKRAPEPRKAPAQPQGAPNGEKGGIPSKLQGLPWAAGIALMALLLVLALPVGNLRALQRATPTAFLRRPGVASMVEDRAAQAENAVRVAQNAGVDEALTGAVQSAVDAFRAADGARALSRADQTLTGAMSDLTTGAALTGENGTMLRRAADNFAEQGSFLRQEARAYNEQAGKALALYEGLPARFLLPEPELYEGV